jgi:hypothetical protein
MRHIRSAVLIIAIAALALSTTACRRPAKVTTFWPNASAERTVPEPGPPLVYPYRGTKAPDLKAIERRPLSVKIENSPASRPQTALNSADVVYETIAEGGITRFNCIFQSVIPPRVGPVRSARLSDIWIVPQYQGLFVFSGASSSVNRAVSRAKLPNLSQDAGVSAPYSRSSRPAPHNLYLDTRIAYKTAVARKYAITARLKPLQYQRSAAETTHTVSEINVPFSTANRIRWAYDAASKTYARFNNGVVHIDEATGKQVRTTNVVVIWAKYTAKSRDKVGSPTYDVSLGGTGRCSIFQEGKRFDGKWTADRTSPPRFKDASGKSLRLVRGTTWFQVLPLDIGITTR